MRSITFLTLPEAVPRCSRDVVYGEVRLIVGVIVREFVFSHVDRLLSLYRLTLIGTMSSSDSALARLCLVGLMRTSHAFLARTLLMHASFLQPTLLVKTAFGCTSQKFVLAWSAVPDGMATTFLLRLCSCSSWKTTPLTSTLRRSTRTTAFRLRSSFGLTRLRGCFRRQRFVGEGTRTTTFG